MLTQLTTISRRIGERFDLVQAGGGNTSLKDTEGYLFVKASGVRLSDIRSENHFAKINNTKLIHLFQETDWEKLDRSEREKKAKAIVSECNLTPERRPSIETLLHAICPGTAVLHTHPLIVLKAFSGGENQEHFQEKFAFVGYNTPGIDLTIALEKSRNEFIAKNSKEPDGVILENHGLVVYGESPLSAFDKTLFQLSEIGNRLGWDKDDNYLYCNEISRELEELTGEPTVTIYAREIPGSVDFNLTPFFPDGVVFLSFGPLRVDAGELRGQIVRYFQDHSIYPKVFIRGNSVYISGANVSKAREIQEVWEFHLQVLHSKVKTNPLLPDEIHYLSQWEAEKYRQNV